MKKSLLLLACAAAALLFSCASGPSYDQAVDIHNVFRQVVLDADAAYAPVYASVAASTQAKLPADDVAYTRAMLPYTLALTALTDARKAEQAMHQILSQADASKNGVVLASTFACAADAADRLVIAFGQVPNGSTLYVVAFAVSAQLRSIAGSAKCEVSQ